MSSSVEPSRPSAAQAAPMTQASFEKFKEDMNRRLAKLTDENWAKDLEIQNLQRLHASEESVSMRLKAECSLHQSKLNEAAHKQAELQEQLEAKEADLQSMKSESSRILREAAHAHQQEVSALKEANAGLRNQLAELRAEYENEREEHARIEMELNDKVRNLETQGAAQTGLSQRLNQELTSLKAAYEAVSIELRNAKDQGEQTAQALQIALQKNTQANEAFRVRENQLNGEVAKMRAECTKVEKGMREAMDAAAQGRAALDALKSQHIGHIRSMEQEFDRRIAALQTQMEESFQRQLEPILADNQRMRAALEVRDTQMEVDRNNLKQWQEQLNFLDQYLNQTRESLKKEKSEILRMAKQLTNELQQAHHHAFKDYIQIADGEIVRLQDQFDNTSTLSPMRAKLEERMAQMNQHREHLKSSLDNVQKQIEERISSLNAIVKSTVVN